MQNLGPLLIIFNHQSLLMPVVLNSGHILESPVGNFLKTLMLSHTPPHRDSDLTIPG